jgi:hypothetical protein
LQAGLRKIRFQDRAFGHPSILFRRSKEFTSKKIYCPQRRCEPLERVVAFALRALPTHQLGNAQILPYDAAFTGPSARMVGYGLKCQIFHNIGIYSRYGPSAPILAIVGSRSINNSPVCPMGWAPVRQPALSRQALCYASLKSKSSLLAKTRQVQYPERVSELTQRLGFFG